MRLAVKAVAERIVAPDLRPASITEEMALRLAGVVTSSSDADTARRLGAGTNSGALGLGEGIQGEIQYHLSFQSRVGPVQWLK